MKLYRARSFKRLLGPWRTSVRAAAEDAELRDEASIDDWGPRTIYLAIGCHIDEAEGYGPPAPVRDPDGSRRLPTVL